VRFVNSNGDVFIADFVARHPQGKIIAVESKTGKRARVTPNQDVGYSELTSSGVELNDSKLAAFGFQKGDNVKMDLEIDHWECLRCTP
jgi:hypothetical protein